MIINDNNKNDTNGFEEAEGEREKNGGQRRRRRKENSSFFPIFFSQTHTSTLLPRYLTLSRRWKKKAPVKCVYSLFSFFV